MTVRPAKFDGDVAALDEARFAQARRNPAIFSAQSAADTP